MKLSAEFTKVDEEHRLVYGFASVIEEDGVLVVDKQGDVIDEQDLVEAAHGFMSDARTGGVMHYKSADGTALDIGRVVESMVFTKEAQKSLGIDLKKVGWYITLKVESPKVWDLVKSGTLKAFSIGGIGIREPIDA